MRRFLTYVALWVSVVLIALAVVLVGLGIASAVGASTVWTGSTSITSPFYTSWKTHQGCGKHTSGVKRGYYGNYRQTFAHCSMTFSTVYVTHSGTPTATPRPTHTPLPPTPPPAVTARPTVGATATDTPTAVPPTSIPATSTPVPTPTVVPTQTAVPPSDPVLFELTLLNQTRAQFGVAPLSLNATQSAGAGPCVGSVGHSVAMAQSGQIWHQNAAYPAASFPNNLCVVGITAAGENVGAGSVFGDPRPMLQQLHNSMMAEGTSNCATVASHACNIINPAFHQVGIGIVVQNGVVWETEDFLS